MRYRPWILVCILLCAITTVAMGDFPTLNWERNGTFDQYAIRTCASATASIAADPDGNVFAGYYFTGTMNLGPGVSVTSHGGGDAFLVKYDPDGNALWARSGGNSIGPGQGYCDETTAVAADPFGNCLITGNFQGTAVFGTDSLFGGGTFAVKYDGAGTLQWAAKVGGAGDVLGNDIAVDATGNCYVTGSFLGTVEFGDTVATSANSSGDMFVVKLDPDGNFVWFVQYDEIYGYWYTPTCVAVNAVGACYAGGLESLIKINPSGAIAWERHDSSHGAAINAIALDAAGDPYITGANFGSIAFGDSSHAKETFEFEGFVVKSTRWARSSGGKSWA